MSKRVLFYKKKVMLCDMKKSFGHIERIQERNKILDQWWDSLKKQILPAKSNVQAIKDEIGAFNFGLRQLQGQWVDANSV